MNRRTARQRAIDETWTWEAMRTILTDARPQLTGRTSRVNREMSDWKVWDFLNGAVGTRTGEISGRDCLTVQNILREFVP